jgi:hypothetical protein
MLENLRDELNRFAKYVIQQSRSNLTKGRSPYGSYNDTKKLYNSLRSEVNVSKNSFQLEFLMEDYGLFQDKGVKGKLSSSKAPNSPYKFGSGTGKKGGLTDGINKWVRRKKFQFRDKKTGRFMSYNSTAFLITRSIYNNGIKPSLFFTKPFRSAFERLPKEIFEAYALDVEQLLQDTIKDNLKK